jgi:hypothetical protein
VEGIISIDFDTGGVQPITERNRTYKITIEGAEYTIPSEGEAVLSYSLNTNLLGESDDVLDNLVRRPLVEGDVGELGKGVLRDFDILWDLE